MRIIQIKDAKAGMKLVQAVTDPMGNLLMKEGLELTDLWIERLRNRKVEMLAVEGEPEGAQESTQSREQVLARIDGEIDHMFAEVSQHAVMKELEVGARHFLKNKVMSGRKLH
jgi:hypothetical protein